mgnify:CR=1 FL=1
MDAYRALAGIAATDKYISWFKQSGALSLFAAQACRTYEVVSMDAYHLGHGWLRENLAIAV